MDKISSDISFLNSVCNQGTIICSCTKTAVGGSGMVEISCSDTREANVNTGVNISKKVINHFAIKLTSFLLQFLNNPKKTPQDYINLEASSPLIHQHRSLKILYHKIFYLQQDFLS